MSRENVLEKCKENKMKVHSILSNENVGNIIKVMAEPLKHRIEQIEKICAIDKYSLCFIGKIGVGKSTAVSNLLGFVNHENFSEGKKIYNIPLLKTAEGRTTLCETSIIYVNEDICKIEIEKMDEKEFNELVNDYCNFLFKKKSGGGEENLPIEIQRVIINMSKYTRSGRDEEKNKCDNLTEQLEDEESKMQVYQTLLKNIKYGERTQLLFECDSDKNDNKWLKEMLEKINYGQIESAPYPEKIKIYVNRNKFGALVPSYIYEIQDTRGMDGLGTREDIITYCSDISKICVICDSINDYGNIISDSFLRNQFISKNIDLKYRNLLLGLEQRNQLEKVNSADGRESGKDIKKEEALSNWKNICLDAENMYFYNAYFGIKYDNEDNFISCQEEKYNQERRIIWGKINSMLDNMYEAYSDELKDINSKLSAFLNYKISNEHRSKLSNICLVFSELKNEISPKYDMHLKELQKQIRYSINAGTVRASVNRKGEYYNYSIYSETKDIALKLFDDICRDKVYYIDKVLKSEFNGDDDLESALLNAISYHVNANYNEYRKIDSENYKSIMFQSLYDNNCWSLMRTYWGNSNGLKYRDRIADGINNETKNYKVDEVISKQQNMPNFFDLLIQFVNVENLD